MKSEFCSNFQAPVAWCYPLSLFFQLVSCRDRLQGRHAAQNSAPQVPAQPEPLSSGHLEGGHATASGLHCHAGGGGKPGVRSTGCGGGLFRGLSKPHESIDRYPQARCCHGDSDTCSCFLWRMSDLSECLWFVCSKGRHFPELQASSSCTSETQTPAEAQYLEQVVDSFRGGLVQDLKDCS